VLAAPNGSQSRDGIRSAFRGFPQTTYSTRCQASSENGETRNLSGPVRPLHKVSSVIATSRAVLPLAQRIVVKVGSSSLTGADGRLDTEALTALVDVIAARVASGAEIVLVTSGAVAAGLAPLGLAHRPKEIAAQQAAASVGQGILIAHYTDAFAAHNLTVGQVLLTAEDAVHRQRYHNARQALNRLLALGVVPIVNENDVVTTDELTFGDNDRLAALVAHLVKADALVLLTDIDGLYTDSPKHPDAHRIPYVGNLDEVADVHISAHGSHVGTGGMVTKIASVRLATAAGVPVVLAAAPQLSDAIAGKDVGTFFAATGERGSARKLWIEHAARVRGYLVLDDGAVRAVTQRQASLLPAGIVRTSGKFHAGDPVELRAADGAVVARGIVGFDAEDMPRLIGRQTAWLREVFGERYAHPVVHRDDMVV
jgi:glutamate 5-kinase